MKAGEKYPIMTVGYFGNSTGNDQVYTPPPSFNFEDLGLSLKVTPRVHDTHEVTLELEAEYKLLTGASSNGIPVISNRRFANKVRLRFNQAAIVAGLVTKSSTRSYSGFPVLEAIPVVGSLLGRTSKSTDDSELLLVLQPRLIDLPPSELVVKQMWVGSETRLLSPL
jgi:general secretion pathway protein D